ncbi:rRNA biogenesis protein rrp5 [Podospora pseudocomata]|uniref:rRNA biogenesis protein rrp5 n=1 Tax=Podospora pseudocomata TaxID=2093779 RepID=A0ABR0G3N6_9PEZI|nr:rRNA biogenesis protein rrp5 [Podospora pseudocomata]
MGRTHQKFLWWVPASCGCERASRHLQRPKHQLSAMGSLKRKEGPDGSASKTAKPTNDTRPSKRAKGSDSTKDSNKKGDAKPSKPSTPATSLIKEEEPLFPRGGASVLTPLEQKQIQIQAKNDVLFEEAASKKSGGEKSKKKKARKSKGGEVEPVKDEDAIKVESLNFKRLVKGSLVLGTVCGINLTDVAVALPNNLVGHVPITAISDIFTQRLQAIAEKDEEEDQADEDDENIDLQTIFRMGQYVRAYVVSTHDDSVDGKPKRHIELSLQPALANSGMSEQDIVENTTLMASVVSVEDHGFVMDVNISDSKLKGFLPRKQLDKGIPEESVQPGSVLLCIATSKAASGKVVQLSTLEDRIGSIKSFPSEATTIDSFLPGTAADILVSEVTEHGLVGKVMGHLDVTADLVHSNAGPGAVDIVDEYKVGSRIKARIICNFPTARKPKLGISLLPHVLSLKPKIAKTKNDIESLPVDILAHSTIIEKCTVQRVEPEIGLYVDVGVEGVPGFVHISRVKDGKVDSLFETSGPYKVGSVHAARVVGYNPFDGMYNLSMEKSVLEQPFLRIQDIPVGVVVPGVVEKLVVNEHGLGGLIVKVAEGISGLVPEMHLSDVHLQHPEKKFREGMKVKTRVLSTNPVRHQLRLTLKKTLVNSDAPPVKSYDELAVGLQTFGTIVKLLDRGAIVQFYGQLRGFLPVSEMSEAYIQDPKEHFREGQTISVYVLSFDPEEKRMIVSCKDPSAFGLEKQVALKKLQIGNLVTAKVTQKTEDDIFVELVEGSLKAILPVRHLTDKSVSKTQSALKKIHVNQTLTELVVLEKNEARRSIILSHKPSLVEAAKKGKLLHTIDRARVGDVVPGFIRNTTATAAFVQFAGRLTALLPKTKLPRDIQDKPSFGFQKLQSVTVKITSVDKDLNRIVVAIPSEGGEDVQAKASSKSADKAMNALDLSVLTMEDLPIGKITKARVKSAKDTQINVDLADNVQGRIDVSQVFDKFDDIRSVKKPLGKFKTGEIIDVRVLGIHDARNHRFLPISHRSSHTVLELSAKPSDLQEGSTPEPLSYAKLEVGQTHLAFVNNVAQNHIWVNLSPNVRGRISAVELSDDLSKLQDVAKSFPIGSVLQVRVIHVDAERNRLDLSARDPNAENPLTWDKIQKGMVLPGKVTKTTDNVVFVKLSESVAGPVFLCDLADDYEEANPLKHSKHEIVRVAVLDIDKSNKRLRLSMRPSRVLSSRLEVTDKEITKDTKIAVGDVLRGFVKNVSDKGLFVTLGGDIVAMVQIKNLSDSYLKDWKEHFQIDQLVKGRIISVSNGRLEMSLRPSILSKDYVPPITFSDLKEGQIVTGKVRKVEDFGAFIDIDGSDRLSGLCHRSEMADRAIKDAKALYSEGDKVKARVLKVEEKTKRINLGLKPSYFKDDDEMDVDSDEDAGAALDSEDEDMSDAGAGGALVINADSDDEDDDDDAGSDVEMDDAQTEGVKGLETGGFSWNADALDEDDKAAGSTDEPIKKKKQQQQRESRAQVDRTAELDVNGPQTTSDYERLLLGQPDSSELWIAYMAFQMQVSDLASARQVAERAIKTINIKEELEKLNVWIAYLNLEVAYGTEETVEELFKRACTYNDEQEVYERLASSYIQSGKLKEADDLFEKIIKKFGSKSPSVWINYAHFLHTKYDRPDKARALLPRAEKSLGGGKPVILELMPKFAALEFRSSNGDREQGRSLFETILAAFPKRFDLWNQFVDLETSVGTTDPATVRDLFDRGSKVKGLKPKQAKTWFKRWAQWEDKNGEKKSRERVSVKAQEWAKKAAEKKGKVVEEEEEEESEDDE